MARNLGWIAALLALSSSVGCNLSIEDDKLGVGDSCRQDRECSSSLVCVDRICVPVTAAGTPVGSDASVNAILQVPTLAPPVPDAGMDGGADAGPDAGDGG